MSLPAKSLWPAVSQMCVVCTLAAAAHLTAEETDHDTLVRACPMW